MNVPSASERNLGGLCHALSVFGFLPPVIIWLTKKGVSEFVCAQAREVLNLQIHLFIVAALLALLWPTPDPLPLIVLLVLYFVLLAVGAAKTWRGGLFRYPLLFRSIR